MKRRISHKLKNIVISVIFFIFVLIPFLIGIIEDDKMESLIEKRKLSKLPEIPKTIRDLKAYPATFDSYYSDHIGLRDWLARYYKLTKYSIGDSPSPDVTIGQDGWLFLGGIENGYSRYGDPFGDARNANLYSNNELKVFAEHMMSVKTWLNQRGIEYFYIIAPNKHTIYSDKLPKYISKENEESAMDQVVKYLKQYTEVTVIDLRKSLIKEKENRQLYSKTDTHWNHNGANIAQYEIMKEIEKLFPNRIKPELAQLRNFTSEEAWVSTLPKKRGDLAKFIGLDSFKEQNLLPTFDETCTLNKKIHDPEEGRFFTVTCDGQQLNTIIFRDSFL